MSAIRNSIIGFAILVFCMGAVHLERANHLYSLNGDAEHTYAEMFQYESNDTITVETGNKYHMMANDDWTVGDLTSSWTYSEGSTGPIASFGDYSGTVAGTILATDVGHGLITGDDISIVGSSDADYDGIYTATKVSNDTFYITNSEWDATATATWYEGAYLEAGTGAAGKYHFTWSCTFASAHASSNNYKFELYLNSTAVDESAGESTTTLQEHRAVTGAGIFTIAVGDRIYLAFKNESDGDDVDCEHANVALHSI